MSEAFLDPQDSEKVLSIVGDSDSFRVVIRGSAIIEDQLKKVVDAAFRDGTPSDLKGLRVPYQLALAEALGFVSPEVVSAIKELRRIRHRVAHGSNEEVTPDDVRAVRKAVVHVFGKDLHAIEQTLGAFLFAIWYAIGSDAEYALHRRAEADEALASRKMKGLPLEDIRKLLESDSSAAV